VVKVALDFSELGLDEVEEVVDERIDITFSQFPASPRNLSI
jgi:hypothetical protein